MAHPLDLVRKRDALKVLIREADAKLLRLVLHPETTPEQLAEALPQVRANRNKATELFAIVEDKLQRRHA